MNGIRRIARTMILMAFLPAGGCKSNLYRSPHEGHPDLKQINYDYNVCRPCHGIDLKGSKGPSCASCHALHEIDLPGWAVKDTGGDHVKAATQGITTIRVAQADPSASKTVSGPYRCAFCHDADGNKVGQKVCLPCHAQGPHSLNPEAAVGQVTNHPAQINKAGKEICRPCHPTSADPQDAAVYFNADGVPKLPPLCVKCHTDPNGQMHWGLTPWRTQADGSPGEHPKYILEDPNDPKTKVDRDCVDCHGEKLDGLKVNGTVIPKTSCASCHAGSHGQFDHVNPKADHRNYLQAQAAAAQIKPSQVASRQCFFCHSPTEDRQRIDHNDLAGQGRGQLVTIPGCKKCHAAYPHPDGWANKQDGGQHPKFISVIDVPAEAWLADLGAVKRHDLSQSGAGCELCHYDSGLKKWDDRCARQECHGPFPQEHFPYGDIFNTHVPNKPPKELCFPCHVPIEPKRGGGVNCNLCHSY